MATHHRVLIVEDSLDDLELMVSLLSEEGFRWDIQRVATESDYLAALEWQPDLILADWTLPSFSGLRALRLMQELGLDTPFIFVTESIDEEAAADALPHGGYDCVRKNRLARLKQTMHNALENKLLRELRNRQEEQLRKLTRAVEQSPVSVMITDCTGAIEYVNPRFTEVTGYPQKEVLGKNPRVLKSGEHPPEKYKELWRALTEGLEWHGEFRNRKKDGTLFWERASICPMRDSSGTTTHYLAVKEDITSTKELEEELRQAQKMESVGRLAEGIAHDFNNLLTVIIGYCEIVLQDLSTDHKSRPELDAVLNAGNRAAALTKQLLTFSRKALIEARPTNLNDVVVSTGNMIRRVIGEDIKMAAMLEPSLGLIMADQGQLEQIIMNLAVNARDAMPRGGSLTMRTQNVVIDEDFAGRRVEAKAGEYVLLEVSDTGIGMDQEVRLQAFEPFFTTKGAGRGTGLGLSTVYGIVRQHEGWIDLETAPGQGARFGIYLPRIQNAGLITATQHKESAKSGLGSGTILVVEDQEPVLRLTVQTLKRCGYVVLQAGNADEAIHISDQFTGAIHLILTDVIMSGMNGKELAGALGARRPEAKILFMSGYADNVITADGKLEPGMNFIAKPFSPHSLAQKVRSILSAGSTLRRILVVDDEPAILQLFQATLVRGGYEVHVATNGDEALAAVSSQPFDLVITDLVMPKREGIETIRELRKRLPTLKIIAISGAFGGEYLAVAKHLGASATLLKPVRPDVLLETVRNVLV